MLRPIISTFIEFLFSNVLIQLVRFRKQTIFHSRNIRARFYLLIIILSFCNAIFAKPVDEATARKVGYNFALKNISSTISENDLTLSYKSEYYDLNNSVILVVDYYVFNIVQNGIKAFIIISGDDVVYPILGYSKNGVFDRINIPENASKWFDGYKNQIRYCVNNHIEATPEIKSSWDNLLIPFQIDTRLYSTLSVAPLIQTTWNQLPYYNELCPYDEIAKQNSVTGCVATAMAQIMKYWNYPINGSGFKSYTHNTYGTISANFGATTYNWSNMPINLTNSNYDVAKLIFHCGVSVSMNYSPQSSGAYVIYDNGLNKDAAEIAFKQYFGYKSTLKGVKKSDYLEADWINLLKSELSLNHPILYAGFGSGGGHAFVADGFDNNNYFHFNWGWGGAHDGYFLINQLNPSSVGTGGGSGSYNNGQQAIIGIEPSIQQPFKLELYSPMSASANPINYGSSFTISTNIANRGLGAFSGDYCAALFDTGYAFVDYIEVKNAQNLLSNNYYLNGILFSTTGSLKFLPGDYYVGIFYRESGGNWMQINGGTNISSMLKIKIASSSDIELYSNILTTPSKTLIKSQPTSINFNLKNTGSSKFLGDYQVNLYNLDGTFAETINSIAETNGLSSGYSYQSPFLNFYTPSIKSSPGSYLLAAIHKSTSNTNWSLTGSTYFSNPIKVIVKNPDIVADKYEINNKMSSAYNFPVSFSNNKTSINTDGSNFHDGDDRDIYKIILPTGSKYLIKARIHDAYSSSNGISYTGDAQFAYTTYADSSKWSATYDDVMPSDIILNDGGLVYFNVWQYFQGTTGNYLLELNISKYSNTAFNPFQDSIAVCSDSLVLDAGTGFSDFLWNTGETAQKITIKNSGKYYVSINNGTPFVSSDTSVVTIIKNKIIQNDTTICSGTPIVLNVNKLTSTIYKVGDRGPAGGYIIFDKGTTSNGWRYIEAAPYEASSGIMWWNGSFIQTNAVNWAIGNSVFNSDLIISKQGNGTYAATVAKNYKGGGYNDWSLPSLDELRLIYTELKKKGLGNLNSDFYWSSSEFNANAAYRINFSNNGIKDGGWKNFQNGAVRPVRYFSGVDSINVLWSNGDTSALIRVQPTKSTNYSVKIQSGKSFCIDSVNINVLIKPILDFNYDKKCVNILVRFSNLSDSSNSGKIDWKWLYGSNLLSQSFNSSYIFNKTGTYSVKLIGSPIQCPSLIDSIIKSITISEPLAGIRYKVINSKKKTPTLVTSRKIGINYLWSPGKYLSDSAIFNPTANIEKEIDYKIIIIDSTGCTTVDSQLVRVFDKYSVFVPTAFSPDGNGINDYLRPLLVGIKDVKSFRIYSRWGNLLYQTKDVSIGWDGTFNGQKMSTDTYTWVFEGFDLDGNSILQSGKTTLIR